MTENDDVSEEWYQVTSSELPKGLLLLLTVFGEAIQKFSNLSRFRFGSADDLLRQHTEASHAPGILVLPFTFARP